MFICFLIPSLSSARITTDSIHKAITNIQSRYDRVDDLTANFTQKTYVAVMNKNVDSSGTIRWQKPSKFFINYNGAKPKQYICNGKNIWIYVPGDTQAEMYKVSDKTIPKEALEFMKGFININENFNIPGWKKIGNTTEFTFIPKSRDTVYSKLKCLFGGDNLLTEVTIYNRSGNVSTYKFSGTQTNTSINNAVFEFKKPKGVKIVKSN